MSCLGSKHELLQVADHVIAHYYQRVPFVRNHPQAIDLDMLVMELMGGSIKMFPLSKDGSMLGMTAHERLIIRIELEDGTVIRDTLRPKDIGRFLAGRFPQHRCEELYFGTRNRASAFAHLLSTSGSFRPVGRRLCRHYCRRSFAARVSCEGIHGILPVP